MGNSSVDRNAQYIAHLTSINKVGVTKRGLNALYSQLVKFVFS